MIQPIRPLTFPENLDEIYLAAVETMCLAPYNREGLYRLFPEADEGSPEAAGSLASAYKEAGEPVAIEMSQEERVGLELSLDRAISIGELKSIRRAFALRNHPDLFTEGGGAQATARMKIANMLIDRRHKEIDARR